MREVFNEFQHVKHVLLIFVNCLVAARLVDSICEIAETTVQLLLRVGLSRSEADAIVVIIQTAFREYLERKKKYPPSEFPGGIVFIKFCQN